MFEVRPARREDAEAVERVRIAGWKTAYRGIVPDGYLDSMPPEGRPESQREYIAGERGKAGIFLVACADRQIVGFVSSGRARDEDLCWDCGEVYACYVEPRRWRVGIGRRLLGDAIAGLPKHGYREVVLWVLERNGSARRFYEALGFAPDGASQELPFGTDLPVREVRYRRSLTAM